MVRLARNLLAARQDGFDVRQLHRGGSAFVPLNHAADHVADQLGVFVEEGIALRLANLLDHHLLGGLGADAADGFFRVEHAAFVSCMNRTVFAVDLHNDIGFFAVVLLRGRY